jgi:hypothetical protein
VKISKLKSTNSLRDAFLSRTIAIQLPLSAGRMGTKFGGTSLGEQMGTRTKQAAGTMAVYHK